MTGTAYPEFVARHDPHPWQVTYGPAARGEVWTDLDGRRMRVPSGFGPFARTARAHELIHAQVSPHRFDVAVTIIDGADPDLVNAAEEVRVNTLARRAGFDPDTLIDGSERTAGERAALDGDWSAAVVGLLVCAATAAAPAFLAGVRRHRPGWVSALKVLDGAARTVFDTVPTAALASLDDRDGWPDGFVTHTGRLARLAQRVADLAPTGAAGSTHTVPRDAAVAAVEAGAYGFAALVWDDLGWVTPVRARTGRRRQFTATGRHLSHPARLLTDPERRVFTRLGPGAGGVVLIDQSGSMDLDADDVARLVTAAPGATVVGYSHDRGSPGSANIWLLADEGRVAARVPAGGTGNGVDGPALRYAIRRRRPGDPLIWVCDGLVSDGSTDQVRPYLSAWCAALVAAHQVHMVATVDEALTALGAARRGRVLAARAIGAIAASSIPPR